MESAMVGAARDAGVPVADPRAQGFGPDNPWKDANPAGLESRSEFTREDLFQLHQELTSNALKLMQKKNADYSTTGPFQNFQACEAYGITTYDGLITRMSDKLSRLASVSRKGAQVAESLDDTLIDLINYSVCFAGLVRSKEKSK